MEKSVVEKCCTEVLEKSVVEKCCTEVLEKSVVERCWQHWCKNMSGIKVLLFNFSCIQLLLDSAAC